MTLDEFLKECSGFYESKRVDKLIALIRKLKEQRDFFMRGIASDEADYQVGIGINDSALEKIIGGEG